MIFFHLLLKLQQIEGKVKLSHRGEVVSSLGSVL